MTRQANGMMDVRLMRTLLTLLTECSVSRTADILGQAQPTVSLTLKRLRDMLDDPLLVRSGGTLVPTERGLALKETLRDILGQINTHLAPDATFDPEDREAKLPHHCRQLPWSSVFAPARRKNCTKRAQCRCRCVSHAELRRSDQPTIGWVHRRCHRQLASSAGISADVAVVDHRHRVRRSIKPSSGKATWADHDGRVPEGEASFSDVRQACPPQPDRWAVDRARPQAQHCRIRARNTRSRPMF